MNTEVIATVRHAGFHRWPECPFEEVRYLKNFHRHEFHIKVWKPVSHTDREVEIIMLKRSVQEFLSTTFGSDFGRNSCEDIATILVEKFQLSQCEVLEDGENGAHVTA